MDVKNYVLTSFLRKKTSLEETIDRATEAVKTWMLKVLIKP